MLRTLATAALAVFMVCPPAWADDPQVGTWKANVARSTYKTTRPPKSQTVTIVATGKDGISVTVHAVSATGDASTIAYAAQYDGQEYPRTETGVDAVAGQTVTLRRLNANTAERVAHLNGKTLTTERWEISKDGKTRTVTQSGVSATGQPVDNVVTYERQ